MMTTVEIDIMMNQFVMIRRNRYNDEPVHDDHSRNIYNDEPVRDDHRIIFVAMTSTYM